MSATKLGDITLTKQTGTILTLNTNKKYVNNDVSFDIDVQAGAGTVTIASTDATVQSDSSGRNISDVVGTKTSSAPSSGYYLKLDASGTGSSVVTTAGWLDAGSIGTASATGTFYFPIQSATASATGTNTVTPSASVSGSNVTLSNTNNGISITATGGGTASASASVTASQSGYAKAGTAIGSGTIVAESQTTTAASYISGVSIPVPTSGTNSFSVTLPNGASDTITLTFTVDASGNWSFE